MQRGVTLDMLHVVALPPRQMFRGKLPVAKIQTTIPRAGE